MAFSVKNRCCRYGCGRPGKHGVKKNTEIFKAWLGGGPREEGPLPFERAMKLFESMRIEAVKLGILSPEDLIIHKISAGNHRDGACLKLPPKRSTIVV